MTPLISHIVHNPAFGSEELESIQVIWSGAASTGPSITNKLLEKAKKFILFREGYGMTELSPACHMIPPNTMNSKLGSCGVALPNTLTRIVDVESGKTLGRNERGEIWIKGPQVKTNYIYYYLLNIFVNKSNISQNICHAILYFFRILNRRNATFK